MTASFSPDTLSLFAELLGQLTIPATHPQIEAVAARCARAHQELADALAAVSAITDTASSQ